jgi:hypothetical protein
MHELSRVDEGSAARNRSAAGANWREARIGIASDARATLRSAMAGRLRSLIGLGAGQQRGILAPSWRDRLRSNARHLSFPSTFSMDRKSISAAHSFGWRLAGLPSLGNSCQRSNSAPARRASDLTKSCIY